MDEQSDPAVDNETEDIPVGRPETVTRWRRSFVPSGVTNVRTPTSLPLEVAEISRE